MVNVWNFTSPLSGGHTNNKAFTYCHYLWSLNVKISAKASSLKQILRMTWLITWNSSSRYRLYFPRREFVSTNFGVIPQQVSERLWETQKTRAAEQRSLRMVWHSFNILKKSLPFGGHPRRTQPLVGTHTHPIVCVVYSGQTDVLDLWPEQADGGAEKKGCDFLRQVFKC